jgi:hypothetical protein
MDGPIVPITVNPQDYFGNSVALSQDGQILAVSAHWEDGDGSGPQDDSVPDSGAVYMFALEGGAWVERHYIKAHNPGASVVNPFAYGDLFGWDLDLSADGTLLAVGAIFEDGSWAGVTGGLVDDDLAHYSGSAYVFGYDALSQGWHQRAFIKASDTSAYAEFGGAVSLADDGQTLVIGGRKAANSGAFYVY